MMSFSQMQTPHNCQTLIDIFDKSAAKPELAEKDYLQVVRTDREERLTFGELRSRARDFAAYLIQKRDVRIADKVAILGKNQADWDIAFWGIILAGAVPVLIDPERHVEGVKGHVLYTDVKLLVMADDYQDENYREELRKLLRGHGVRVTEMAAREKPLLEGADLAVLMNKIRAQIKASDTAVIVCTSGTTGDPREVEITHANLIANIQGALGAVRITAADRLGHVIPPHHSFDLTVAKLIPLWVGATNIYTNRYHQIPQLIRDREITIFIGIPALFTVLARKIEERIAQQKEKSRLVRLADRYLPRLVGRMIVKKLGWGSLQFFVSGAAPVAKWVLQVFWKRGLQLREGYGTTENSPVYGFNASRKKSGSVGKPISTVLVKIVDAENEMVKPCQRGEIVLGGPCIVKGYYKNPKATQEVIKTDENGLRWLYTGDLGYLDEDGYLFVTGRKKYLIVLPGGKNVNPELVELALSEADYVEELVVVPGYQDGRASIEREAVKVIVRPAWDQIQADTNLSRQDLVNRPEVLKDLVWESINKCQQDSQQLAGFERVQSKNLVEINISEFQKTSTGKIRRESYVEAGTLRK